MARKSTIGNNPLDAVIPPSSRLEERPEQHHEPGEAQRAEPKERPPQGPRKQKPVKKERLTVQLDADLIEKARDACFWDRVTLAALVEEGIRSTIAKLERARGEEFTPRKSPIKRGRPFKA